jgi:hypothetical protein
MMAKVMVDKEAALPAEQQLSFKGFMIGNPYNNPGENNYGMVTAFWGHQLLPLHLWEVRVVLSGSYWDSDIIIHTQEV